MHSTSSNTATRFATRLLIRVSNAYRRLLAVFVGVIGPRPAYALFAFLARQVYRLSDALRQRSEAQCQAALGQTHTPAEIADIAAQAFVHRAWNLADLMLASRLVRRSTYRRFGGRVPEPYRGLLLDAQRRRQPIVLLTAYYGPFDMLPLFLGYNGIRAAAIYRRHVNPAYDAYRSAIRARSGCEMIPDTQAVQRLPAILEQGGTVAILADHHAAGRGVPVSFMGLETVASRSVGLLAEHYGAIVAVAGVRRQKEAFQFELVVSDLFDPNTWRDAEDPVAYITNRYLRAVEQIVLGDPRQYLWAHVRWGADLASRLAGEADPSDNLH